ncbi:excalibur calcium-binding domain-containing protein [Peribacillus sp. TH24]|nr:excalibur calcium-binding domain-containing protein [Peribacillus sp. TH24]MBK5461987.1 excalibur calcium-binding domain-containing protein [Peribacillus sp. TH27]MBK5500147.1 excalibur calcium-binding domain-containing protein [Peribacillus sp. TH14]
MFFQDGFRLKYKPHVSKALYDANKKSDRDKDLIACEN